MHIYQIQFSVDYLETYDCHPGCIVVHEGWFYLFVLSLHVMPPFSNIYLGIFLFSLLGDNISFRAYNAPVGGALVI